MNRLKRVGAVASRVLLFLGVPLIVGFGFVLWPQAASQQPISPVSALVVLLTTSPAEPAPPPTHATSSAIAVSSRSMPSPTPLPGSLVLALTPAPDGIGWATDLDGKTHFGVPGIHAGLLNGYAYQGVLQFDLTSLPSGAAITHAALELTGLDASNLDADASWQVDILPSSIDATWVSLSYQALLEAENQGAVSVVLTTDELGAGKVNTFRFGPETLPALQQRAAAGTVSFRLAGPASGSDNLFTWDTGYRLRNELNTKPTLILHVTQADPQNVIVTSTPTPENVVTAAAVAVRATEVARTVGTYTPVPKQWVTPVVVTPKAIPGNAATAAFQAAVATAESFLYGTPTRMPPNVWTTTPVPQVTIRSPGTVGPTHAATRTPTSTPTPVFVVIAGQLPPLPPTRTPTPAPLSMPKVLIGKIAFLSDRAALADDPAAPALSNPQVYVVNPDGTGLALLTDPWPYEQAVRRDRFSADQHYRAFVRDVKREDGRQPAVHYYDYLYGSEGQVTTFGRGIAYDAVWSPTGDRLALVSNDSGNDEIWVVNRDGGGNRQLTRDGYSWWDKHPSWSPDGKQIVFWSNRSGKRQIWIMDADGRNPHTLSLTGYNDWDPVWIKYEDPPRYTFAE